MTRTFRERGAKRPDARGAGASRSGGGDLFPPSWPWRAWQRFPDALPPAVYPRRPTCGRALREHCRGVTGWLQHLEYEGDIARDDSFTAAATLIPVWPDAEVRLAQARQLWETLVSKAAAAASRPDG